MKKNLKKDSKLGTVSLFNVRKLFNSINNSKTTPSHVGFMTEDGFFEVKKIDDDDYERYINRWIKNFRKENAPRSTKHPRLDTK